MAGFSRGIGKPRIKMHYGQSIGRVGPNIQRKIRKGGVSLRKVRIRKFGYGG